MNIQTSRHGEFREIKAAGGRWSAIAWICHFTPICICGEEQKASGSNFRTGSTKKRRMKAGKGPEIVRELFLSRLHS